MKMIGLFLSIILAFQVVPNHEKQNPLLKMVEVASEKNISITNWKVYIKKNAISATTTEEVKKKVQDIMKSHLSYKWEPDPKKAQHHYTKVGHKKSQLYGLQEQITIIVLNEGQSYNIYTTYEILGNDWNDQTWEYLHSAYDNEIEENIAYYSVYGSKEINKGLTLEEEANSMLSSFSAKEVEGMKENNFISLSAHVKDWEIEIPTKEKKVFNLQFGLRVDPSKKFLNVAIGSPLITSGY